MIIYVCTSVQQASKTILSPRTRSAWRNHKQWSTGCRDGPTSTASGNTHSVVLRPHSESSQPTPRRCWRSLGPTFRTPGASRNNKNNRRRSMSFQLSSKTCITNYQGEVLLNLQLFVSSHESIATFECWQPSNWNEVPFQGLNTGLNKVETKGLMAGVPVMVSLLLSSVIKGVLEVLSSFCIG